MDTVRQLSGLSLPLIFALNQPRLKKREAIKLEINKAVKASPPLSLILPIAYKWIESLSQAIHF